MSFSPINYSDEEFLNWLDSNRHDSPVHKRVVQIVSELESKIATLEQTTSHILGELEDATRTLDRTRDNLREALRELDHQATMSLPGEIPQKLEDAFKKIDTLIEDDLGSVIIDFEVIDNT